MTTNELMAVRYKVIADFPTNPFLIGSILTQHDESADWFTREGFVYPPIQKVTLEAMPHLFKKLFWWEERKESDMPEYVKNNHEVIKILSWSMETDGLWCTINFAGEINKNKCYQNYLPATESEYLTLNK